MRGRNKGYDKNGVNNPMYGNLKSPISEQELSDMYETKSMAEIGAILNVNAATVLSYLRRYKIPSKPRPIPRGKFKGSNSWNWKGGISTEQNTIRHSVEYTDWRTSVFTRDKYTCRDCGAKNGNGTNVFLHAHHIKSFSDYPDLRFDINNGITLCEPCHAKYHPKIGTFRKN